MDFDTFKKEFIMYCGDALETVQMPTDSVLTIMFALGATPYEMAEKVKDLVASLDMAPGKDPDTYTDHPDAELRKDTKVIKINELPGDKIKNGYTGFVKGSGILEGQLFYMVVWDALPDKVNPIPPLHLKRYAAAYN